MHYDNQYLVLDTREELLEWCEYSAHDEGLDRKTVSIRSSEMLDKVSGRKSYGVGIFKQRSDKAPVCVVMISRQLFEILNGVPSAFTKSAVNDGDFLSTLV